MCVCDALQVNLGNMYYNGLGVVKSREKAKQLYEIASASDDNARLLLEELQLEEKEEEGGDDGTRKS